MPNMIICSSGTIRALNWKSAQRTSGAGQHIANDTAAKISRLNEMPRSFSSPAHPVRCQPERHYRHRARDLRPIGGEQRARGDQQRE
jgi:hypothetical protein